MTFSVTIDSSAGFGSYSGDATYFFDLQKQRFHWLTFRNPTTGKDAEIQVLQSLKSSWTLSPAPNLQGLDILQIACRPKIESLAQPTLDFELIFTRFTFDGSRWARYERKKPGYWEQGDDFPSRDEFP